MTGMTGMTGMGRDVGDGHPGHPGHVQCDHTHSPLENTGINVSLVPDGRPGNALEPPSQGCVSGSSDCNWAVALLCTTSMIDSSRCGVSSFGYSPAGRGTKRAKAC